MAGLAGWEVEGWVGAGGLGGDEGGGGLRGGGLGGWQWGVCFRPGSIPGQWDRGFQGSQVHGPTRMYGVAAIAPAGCNSCEVTRRAA